MPSAPSEPTGSTEPDAQSRGRTTVTAHRLSGSCGPWRPRPGWRDLLSSRDPDELLDRLLASDDLCLRRLIGNEIRAAAYFLDADRVHLRALARLVHGAALEGPPSRRHWVEARVREAIADVMDAERVECAGAVSAEAGGGGAVGEGEEPVAEHGAPLASAHDILGQPLGLQGMALRRACAAFNAQPFGVRIAFFLLLVERCPLDEAAVACSSTPTDVARRARRGLLVALHAASPAGDPPCEGAGSS